MRRLFSLVLVAGLAAMAAVVIPAVPASAMTYSGPVVLGCESFTATGELVSDRNNTGLSPGQERIQVDIFDGTDALIFSAQFQNLNGTYSAGLTGSTPLPYDEDPVANPLRFVMTSLPGNGFEEQLVLETTGSCNEVPTVNCTLTEESPPVEPGAAFAPTAIAQRPGLCGVVEITKNVSGTVLADTQFTVTVTCQAPPEEPDEPDQQADLPPGLTPPFGTTVTFDAVGGTKTLYIGAGSCTVAETNLPAGCVLDSITPAQFEVEPTETTQVTVANTCTVRIEPNFTG